MLDQLKLRFIYWLLRKLLPVTEDNFGASTINGIYKSERTLIAPADSKYRFKYMWEYNPLDMDSREAKMLYVKSYAAEQEWRQKWLWRTRNEELARAIDTVRKF